WGKTGENAMLPWLMSPAQQELLRYYLKLRYRLHPYLYSSAIEAHLTGRPILAPLVFDYQDDEKTYDKGYHFMLGRQILVAPITEEKDEWKVYLPKGNWAHYWTGKEYSGGTTVTVKAPLYGKDGLPMFVKAGAIIPMMPEMSYIYEKAPKPITLDIYPDPSCRSSSVMFDCETVKSSIKVTTFNCSEDSAKIEISIGSSDVPYELCVHDQKEPSAVVVNLGTLANVKDKGAYDEAESGWYYGPGCFYGSESIRTVNIKVPSGSKSHLVQILK
ncbi:MAG: hypothetical protein ACYTBJ_17970, partial [Planctomycetota bacterium]